MDLMASTGKRYAMMSRQIYEAGREYTWIFHPCCKVALGGVVAFMVKQGSWPLDDDGKPEPPSTCYGLPVRISAPLFVEFKRFAVDGEPFVLIPTAHIDGLLQSVRDFSRQTDHAMGKF